MDWKWSKGYQLLDLINGFTVFEILAPEKATKLLENDILM